VHKLACPQCVRFGRPPAKEPPATAHFSLIFGPLLAHSMVYGSRSTSLGHQGTFAMTEIGPPRRPGARGSPAVRRGVSNFEDDGNRTGLPDLPGSEGDDRPMPTRPDVLDADDF